MKTKTTNIFSKPLFLQDFKSNRALMIAIILIMCLMSGVITVAMNMMKTEQTSDEVKDAQVDFYSYLAVMATYNSMSGSDLSYQDFTDSSDKTVYENVFAQMGKQMDTDLSVEEFQKLLDTMKTSDIPLNTYVKQFEYAYALAQSQGCFDGEELNLEEMLTITLEVMGVDSDLVESMSNIDTTSMLNSMYYTVMGLLPIFILIVILSNSLLASQVDNGSMAYILSTPTKRKAVAFTQIDFMVVAPLLVIAVVCAVRVAVTYVVTGDANAAITITMYLGMYILIEAVSGICYLGSCLFNQSSKSLAFGGGITVWFFLASLLGMFGSKDIVNMGMGVEELDVFNHLTLIGLFDVKAIGTIGSEAIDYAFVWKFAILIIIAMICYAVGAVRFQKKDLPL